MKSNELRIEEVTPFNICAQQITNDLHELFFVNECFDLERIERIVLGNMKNHFTQTRTAELTGLAVRTIRNKLNERV